jgi:hypothetical protein
MGARSKLETFLRPHALGNSPAVATCKILSRPLVRNKMHPAGKGSPLILASKTVGSGRCLQTSFTIFARYTWAELSSQLLRILVFAFGWKITVTPFWAPTRLGLGYTV